MIDVCPRTSGLIVPCNSVLTACLAVRNLETATSDSLGLLSGGGLYLVVVANGPCAERGRVGAEALVSYVQL